MAKSYLLIGIGLLFCFDVAQSTSYLCVDEKCSTVADKVKLQVNQPTVGKKGDTLLLFGRSSDKEKCLVQKTKGKWNELPCEQIQLKGSSCDKCVIEGIDYSAEPAKLPVNTNGLDEESLATLSKHEQDSNESLSNQIGATSDNLTETESELENSTSISENMEQTLQSDVKKVGNDPSNSTASSDVEIDGKPLSYQNLNSKDSIASQNKTINVSIINETSSTMGKVVPKPTIAIENKKRSDWKFDHFLKIVQVKLPIERRKNETCQINITNAPQEKIPNSGYNNSMINDERQETETASNDQKEKENVENRPNEVIDDSNQKQGVMTNDTANNSSSHIRNDMDVVFNQTMPPETSNKTNEVDLPDQISANAKKSSTGLQNDASVKVKDDVEKESPISKTTMTTSLPQNKAFNSEYNNNTNDERQETNVASNNDVEKKNANVENRHNKVIDRSNQKQDVVTNDTASNSSSRIHNDVDAVVNQTIPPKTLNKTNKVNLADQNPRNAEKSSIGLQNNASVKVKDDVEKVSPINKTTKTTSSPRKKTSNSEYNNSLTTNKRQETETAFNNVIQKKKANLENHQNEINDSNQKQSVVTNDTGYNSSAMESAVNESLISNDVSASSETTFDDKIAENIPKISANEGDTDTSKIYELIRKTRTKKVDPIPKENYNIDQTLSLTGKIWEYIPDTLSLLLYVDKMKNTINALLYPEKSDIPADEHCTAEPDCDSRSSPSQKKVHYNIGFESFVENVLFGKSDSKKLKTIFVCLILITFLVFVYFYLRLNLKKEKKINQLITAINQLEKKLFVAKKEIVLLNEKSVGSDEKVHDTVEDETNSTLIATLEDKVQQYQQRNTDLEDRVVYLERELENVSTSALEMHKLLENSLSTQVSSKIAEDEVECLRTLTEKQENQIEDLIREMDLIVTENQCLKDEFKKIQKENGIQVKKNLELTEKLRDLKLRFDLQIESHNLQCNNHKSEVDKLTSKLEDTEMNLKRSEFQIAELNRAYIMKQESENDATSRSFEDDHSQLKVQLATLKAMNNELVNELKEQKKARRTLDEHVGDVIRELNNVKKSYEITEKERNEAVTKLYVLTDYFKDKESQLHKELEEKDKLFVENEYKDQLLSQKLASLKEEIENQKRKNDELKKEIEDQENSFKIQLANAEQKARDHWFMLRQAERKYQESEKESATLRNRILILETNLSGTNQKLHELTKLNGDVSPIPGLHHSTTSSDLLPFRNTGEMIPPSSPLASHPLEFLPPAPSYSPDERLPPLGGRRVPSPLMSLGEYDDFEPPPPNIQYMSGRNRHEQLPISSSFVPPPPQPMNRHRPLYEGRGQRSSIDSPSSGMSVESLDKSGR